MEKVNASAAVSHFTPEEAALCIKLIEARTRRRYRSRRIRAFGFSLFPQQSDPLDGMTEDEAAANMVGEAWESVGDYLRLAMLRHIAQTEQNNSR